MAAAPGAQAPDYEHLYQQALAHRQQELQELHYVISHDLQEPLRKITGFAGLLRRRYAGQLDADADEYIDFMSEACERMHVLIQDLLRLSRIDTRGRPFAPVATAELVTAIADRLADTTPAPGGAAIEVEGELPVVVADGEQLAQVFQALVDNAVKFHGPAPPRIRIAAERQEGGWSFRVADNGIGIEARFASRIFGIFQRLHTRDEYPGNGTGLALCRKIIERHGGAIEVEPGAGAGSTFRFTLPDLESEPSHVEE